MIFNISSRARDDISCLNEDKKGHSDDAEDDDDEYGGSTEDESDNDRKGRSHG